jgi:hypothetical protein
MDQRATLKSTGVHLGAVRRLGSSYTDEEYVEAVERARDAGDGERYASTVLGPDVDDVVRGVEEEDDLMTAAAAVLKDRGISLDDATQGQLRDALVAVSR